MGCDANMNVNAPSGHIATMMRRCKLCDPISILQPSKSNIPTHTRGSHRIDTVLVRQEAAAQFTYADVSSFDDITDTDHRAVFCDIPMQTIKCQKASVSETGRRTLVLNRPRMIQKYIAGVKKEFEKSKVKPRLQKIIDNKKRGVQRKVRGCTTAWMMISQISCSEPKENVGTSPRRPLGHPSTSRRQQLCQY